MTTSTSKNGGTRLRRIQDQFISDNYAQLSELFSSLNLPKG